MVHTTILSHEHPFSSNGHNVQEKSMITLSHWSQPSPYLAPFPYKLLHQFFLPQIREITLLRLYSRYCLFWRSIFLYDFVFKKVSMYYKKKKVYKLSFTSTLKWTSIFKSKRKTKDMRMNIFSFLVFKSKQMVWIYTSSTLILGLTKEEKNQ